MTEQLTIDGPTVAYAPLQFLMDVRNGVWSEAAKPGTAVTIYRRNLQRAYLEIMDREDQRHAGRERRDPDARQGRTERARPPVADRGGRSRPRREHAPAFRRRARRDCDHPRPEGAAAGTGAPASLQWAGVAAVACVRTAGGRDMLRQRTLVTWSLALGCGLAFLAGSSALRAIAGRVRSRARRTAAGTRRRRAAGQRGSGPRPYDEVITSAAKTDDGIFKVHRITDGNRDTLYYEIAKSELDKDFLWNTQIKRTTIGAGYGGQNVGSRVVRWVAEGRPRPAPGHRLHARRRSEQSAERRSQPAGDRSRVPGRSVRGERRPGDRRDGALHDGRPGVLGARRRRRPRDGRDADVPREGGVVPAEHQRRSDGDLHDHARTGRGRCGRRTRRRPWRRRARAERDAPRCTTPC